MNASAEAARRIDTNPLGRLMYGQRELFHSNLLAWFFDTQEQAADAVFRPFSNPAPGETQERRSRREERHLDLVLRWPERSPLIIENKTFSMPLPGQLDEYRHIAQAEYPQAALLLLSLSPSDFDPTPWAHLTYRELAARIRAELPEQTSYEAQTMLKWCDLADALQDLVESVAVHGDDEPIWLTADALDGVHNSQTVTALHKARAQRVAAHLQHAVPGQRTHVWSALAHGTPLVEILEPSVVDGKRVDLGWQLQDNQFRRVVRFKQGQFKRHGKRASAVADEFCAQHPELFESPPIPGAAGGGRKPFNHFGVEFVYRYVKVPHLTIAQLVDAATAVHNAIAEHQAAGDSD